MSDLTVIVKTILRPEKCRAMLVSLREHFDGPVVVCDDSPVGKAKDALARQLRQLDVRVESFQEDVGIGVCLNNAIGTVVTPYGALLDDDFIITEKTEMARWLPFIEHDIYDVIGGAVRRKGGDLQGYLGMLEYGNRSLTLHRIPDVDAITQVTTFDLVLNFFAGKTETLRRIGWDENLKVFRHEDWFLRAKHMGIKVGYHPGVEVLHDTSRNDEHKVYRTMRRDRLPEFRAMFCEKWDIDE